MPSVAGLHKTFKCLHGSLNHMIEMMVVALTYVVTVECILVKIYCVAMMPSLKGHGCTIAAHIAVIKEGIVIGHLL